MMDFADPRLLVWLWLVPLMAVVLVVAEKSRRRRVAAFAGARMATVRLLRGRAALKLGLRLLALTAVIVALAGPRWGFAWQNVKRQGADIMLAVDVSKSMLATDVDPDRLTRARRELVDLLGLLQGDRIGLTAFAGEAFVQCPLTEDYGAARMFIDLLTPDLIPVQGTDLGRAIDVALKGLDDGSPAGSEGRAIVLITDGEDQEGKGKAAAERLKDSGVKLYTIGIGSTGGAPIPEAGGGFKKDAKGEVIMTRPDEATLQAMALASGGMYVRSVAGDLDLRRLYTEGIRAGVGQKEISSGREKLWFERYQWLVLLAFLALCADLLIMDVRRSSRGKAAASVLGLVAFLLMPVFGNKAVASPSDARAAFETGDYPAAAAEYQAAEVDDPDEPRHAYNRALSQYKAGQFGDASQGFERAAALAGEPKLKQDSWFNLGNARVGAGKLAEAKAAYEQALALDPGDRSARENLEYVKKLLEEQQKEQQEQQKNDQQKDDQKKDDQQQDQKQDQQDQQKQDQQDQQDQQKQDQQDGDGQKPEQPPPEGGQSDEQKQDEQAKQDQQQQDQQEQQQQEQQRSEAEQQAAAQQAAAGEAQQDMKDMDAQEAERLLQSVEDQATKYHYRPEGGERGSEPRQSDKDW